MNIKAQRLARRGALTALVAAGALVVTTVGGVDAGDDVATAVEPTTITFSWWGADDRANRYMESLELFNEQYPDITVQTSFAAFPDYWPARATEAAGGALPDVMQMDLAFLSQYASAGQLLPLDDFMGSEIDVSGFEESLLPSGQLDGVTYALPVGTNAFSLFYNPATLEQLGVEPPAETQTWEEYDAFLTAVSEAGAEEDPQLFGGADYTGTFWIFIHKLRQDGKEVFTDDGQIAFTPDDLREWWNSTSDLRDAEVTFPQSRAEQLLPLSPFAANEAASELSWDNFLAGYIADSGAEEMVMLPIPSDDPDNLGLFLKPSMQFAVAENTDSPEAAALLVDFLLNDPGVGEIFGTSKGLPASSTQRDAVPLEGVDAQVAAYEESIAEYLSESPPPLPEGFGVIEENFRRISLDINLGATSVDDGVEQWFDEAETALNQ